MNSWQFNEVTQQDILDFKACQRKDGTVYGVPDKSDCVKGKEIKKEDLYALAKKANRGDAKAKAKLAEIDKAEKAQKKKARDEKKAADEAKKKAEAEKGKKGKGKKGGGKGKKAGGKSKGGGAAKPAAKASAGRSQMQANAKKAQAQAQAARNKRAQEIRSRISELQKTLRQIKNPELRKALEEQMSLALKSVSALQQGQSVADQSKPGGTGATPPKAPAAPQAPAVEK